MAAHSPYLLPSSSWVLVVNGGMGAPVDLVSMALHVYGHFVRQVVGVISAVVDLGATRTIPTPLAVTRIPITQMTIKIRRLKTQQVRKLHQQHRHAAHLQLCLIAPFSALLQRAPQLKIVQQLATPQPLDAAQPGQR